MLALVGLVALGCGSAAAPEVDPHQAAADWFEENRGYVAATVIHEIHGHNPALAAVQTDYLDELFQTSVRTELRDVGRVDLSGQPVFTAVLWTLAELEVDTGSVKGSVAVDFPWGLVIQARGGETTATALITDMDLRVSIEGVSVEVEGIPVDKAVEMDDIPVDEAKDKLEGLLGN